MNTVKIPEPQWQQFCESFSHQHHGWMVNMYQLDTRLLEQDRQVDEQQLLMLPGNRPLQEVREDKYDNQAEIMVTVGRGHDATSILIEHAIALFSYHENSHQPGIRIDSDNGISTMLEFRAAVGSVKPEGMAQ